jgi:hypothetical protein
MKYFIYRIPTSTTSKLISEKWTPVTNPIQLSYMNINSISNMNSTINIEQHLSGGKASSKL